MKIFYALFFAGNLFFVVYWITVIGTPAFDPIILMINIIAAILMLSGLVRKTN